MHRQLKARRNRFAAIMPKLNGVGPGVPITFLLVLYFVIGIWFLYPRVRWLLSKHAVENNS